MSKIFLISSLQFAHRYKYTQSAFWIPIDFTESIEDIYANIPDLPKSYIPSRLRKERKEGTEDNEQNRKGV
jgi:hypothetical protein